MNWQSALSYAENSTLAGYSDWFLPDAKQLQSIVDYSQSPYATNSANVGPAIDDRYFHLTNTGSTSNQDYGYYWSSTTHVEGGTGDYAVYIAFGTAWGYTNNRWQDVHGAGAQRSDPKAQDGSYPVYNGPQGDYLSISNYALIARQVADDVSRTGSTGADQLSGDTGNDLLRGGPGNDSEVGASGHDTLFGGIGADTLNGGAGADLLYGNAGRDLIDGGAGSDTVYAGADDDTVYGGNYSDYLSGDKGNDLLYGGDDADVFLFNSANFGADTIGDFTISQKDRLALSSGATWSVASDALGDAVITISTGGSVTLKGVASTSVSSDLFLTL
jgi:Ca2+-binding RTX toxin-like protein